MSFFYNIYGDIVTVYIDLVLVINFIIDLILLITVAYILKREVSSKRFVLGASFGSLTTLLLFFKLNNFTLFILKLLICIFMNIITFKYKNFKYLIKNISYFYIVSILLGGFMYYLNIEFSYKSIGLTFRKYNLSINYVFILLFSPIILFLYSKQLKELKIKYSNYYLVDIYLNDNIISVRAYLDTGNTLCDPYLKRPIIILNKRKMIYDINEFKMVLVPYKTISGSDILECIIATKVEIKGIGSKNNVLIGLSDNNINIDDVDLILNTKLLEEIYA